MSAQAAIESVLTAERETRQRREQLNGLLEKAKAKDCKLASHVAYDGDCLFSSIKHLLASSKSSSDLRKELVDFFVDNRANEEWTFITEEFLHDISQPYKEVHDDRVIKGLCAMLRREIIVFTFTATTAPLMEQKYRAPSSEGSDPLYIGHIIDKHFVPLCKVNHNVPTPVNKQKRKRQQTLIQAFSKRTATCTIQEHTDAETESTCANLDGVSSSCPSAGRASTNQTMTSAESVHTSSSAAESVNTSSSAAESVNTSSSAAESVNTSSSAECHGYSAEENDIAYYAWLKSTGNLYSSKFHHILTKDWTPKLSKFPANHDNRRYSLAWEKKWRWLAYSKSQDGAYCKVCLCYVNPRFNTEFSNLPFKDWKNASGETRGALKRHADSESHISALKKAEQFLAIAIGQNEDILTKQSTAYQEKVKRNKRALLSILDVVIVLGQRGLALRGDWNKETKSEDGNFRFFVEWKSKMDEDLAHHLKTAPKNAQYLSPQVQNELIECIGDLIRQKIVHEINQSEFISVLADETTDAAVMEQLSLCVRNIQKASDQETEVHEDFLGFVEIKTPDAETISNAIVTNLQQWGVDMSKLRGQGYDGASVMAGDVAGVKARIARQYPQAKHYTHDANHRLNLVIVATCKNVPDVRNFMQSFQKLSFFLSNSAKRKSIVKSHVKGSNSLDDMVNIDLDDLPEDQRQLQKGSMRQSIPTLCDTRWMSRGDSISAFLANISEVHDALDEIRTSSTCMQSSNDAQSYIYSIQNFKFVYTAVVTQYMLAFIKPLSVALQSESCNLVEAHDNAQELISTVQQFRDDVQNHQMLYQRAVVFAEKIGVEPTRPRAAGRQRHRANAAANEPIDVYYKINIFYPFVDHILSSLKERFPEEMRGVMLASYLIPSKLDKLTEEAITTIKESFADDLDSPTEIDQEIMRWRVKWQRGRDKPTTLNESLNQCNPWFFPNIVIMLTFLLALPVGSVACERSFSKLRRLKTWDRCTMGECRLNGLALMYIHKDLVEAIPRDAILKKWDETGHRRIALAFDE